MLVLLVPAEWNIQTLEAYTNFLDVSWHGVARILCANTGRFRGGEIECKIMCDFDSLTRHKLWTNFNLLAISWLQRPNIWQRWSQHISDIIGRILSKYPTCLASTYKLMQIIFHTSLSPGHPLPRDILLHHSSDISGWILSRYTKFGM